MKTNLRYLSIFIFKGHFESAFGPEEEPTHFTEEKVSIETDDGKLKTELGDDDSLSDEEGTCT